jgi:muconate cycloisomerase
LGTRDYTGSLVIMIHSDEGLTGLGDVIIKGGSPEEGKAAKLYVDDALAPLLVGENPFDLERLMDRLWTATWHRSTVYAAGLDIALHDLICRALGIPLYQFLGGQARDRVPLTWNVPATRDISTMLRQATTAVENGFTHVIKVKTGTPWDVEALVAIQKAIGPAVPLRPDDNGAFLAGESIRRYREARDRGVIYELLEQPAPNSDLVGLRRVGDILGERVMYHIGYVQREVAVAIITQRAADVVSVPVFRHGIRQAVELVKAFDLASIGCAMGSGVEGSIAATAAIHVATALRNMCYPVDTLGPLWFADDILLERPDFGAGYATAPAGPGLGIELDPKKVERYRAA